MFLSTRPRGARPISTELPYAAEEVSIHAPAGGATKQYKFEVRTYEVSIHAPAGGATYIWTNVGEILVCFYPRARGGRDTQLDNVKQVSKPFLSTRPRGARLLYPKRLEITKL